MRALSTRWLLVAALAAALLTGCGGGGGGTETPGDDITQPGSDVPAAPDAPGSDTPAAPDDVAVSDDTAMLPDLLADDVPAPPDEDVPFAVDIPADVPPAEDVPVDVGGGSAMVGPEGGIASGPGGIALVVPAGALTAEVEILFELVADPGLPELVRVTPAVRIEPAATTFALPVALRLPVDISLMPGGATLAEVAVYAAPSLADAFAALPTVPEGTDAVAADVTRLGVFVGGVSDPVCFGFCARAMECLPELCAIAPADLAAAEAACPTDCRDGLYPSDVVASLPALATCADVNDALVDARPGILALCPASPCEQVGAHAYECLLPLCAPLAGYETEWTESMVATCEAAPETFSSWTGFACDAEIWQNIASGGAQAEFCTNGARVPRERATPVCEALATCEALEAAGFANVGACVWRLASSEYTPLACLEAAGATCPAVLDCL